MTPYSDKAKEVGDHFLNCLDHWIREEAGKVPSPFRENLISQLAKALLEAEERGRKEEHKRIMEILNDQIKHEKLLGEDAKGHMASQHYGAMMVLENLSEAIREGKK